MPRVYLLLAIIGTSVIIYALIDCIRSERYEVRGISKPAWILTILLLPLIGAGLWFLFGRPTSSRPGGTPRPAPRHPTAPDDDPDFLRNLETRRRQQAREADLNKREQELRAREERLRGEGPDTGKAV